MTSQSRPAPPLRPLAATERVHALDAMRGVAILGVLVAYTMWNLGNLPEDAWTGADRVMSSATGLLVDNKFLTMFAFLFGLGVCQQWRRWEGAGHDPAPLHLRRMTFLLAVGLLHAALLRNGDILAPYAILGLALLAFRRAPNRVVAVAAVLLAAAPHVAQGLAATGTLSLASRPTGAGGGYIAENLAWLGYWYLTNPLLSWPRVLALMLGGVLAGRVRLIERLAADRRPALRALVVALLFAVFFHVADAVLVRVAPRGLARGLTLSALFQLGSWALSATYAALLLLATQSPRITSVLWPVRAVGRMAFTNYLVQALLIVPVCLAFGLFDAMTPTLALGLALSVTALQLWYSTRWLASRESGPLERLWRRVTYGSRGAAAPQPATAT